MTSEESAKYGADEVIQELARERHEKNVLVEGSAELFRLIVDQTDRLPATGPEASPHLRKGTYELARLDRPIHRAGKGGNHENGK